jgi:arylformamidase
LTPAVGSCAPTISGEKTMQKIYDISVTITPALPVWPGDPAIKLERVNKIEEGANANVSHLDMGVHTGTHVDAPFHFLPGGKTIETLPLEVLVGECWVVELPKEVGEITGETIERLSIPAGVKRLLFKTRNSDYWASKGSQFQTDFVGVTRDGADALVKLGIQLVGIDYLSISPYKKSRPTHEALLGVGMVILEGCDLSAVPAGKYTLYCLPLKLGGSDGAPARSVLVAE